MAKKGVKYVCSNCGAIYGSFMGRCSNCGEWNTLTEQLDVSEIKGRAGGKTLSAKLISEFDDSKQDMRMATGIGEVDNVLGGGIVKGSTILIAGQPGIGKSTILLQMAHGLANSFRVLYVSGEESANQILLRAKRLKAVSHELKLTSSTSANDVATTIASKDYDIVIVDSIQTMAVEELSPVAGSVSQITNSTQLITMAAKQANTAVIFVGHVTKEGSIAGPKLLEHVVDVVLQLEGDRYGGFKILRGVKNRFGSTNEIGIFEMKDLGLVPVDNPSASLLSERQVTDGSVVLATMEGSRAILVEVQALVNKTSYGYPKRTASGVDLNRVNLLVAMLERRTKLNFADQDIFINIVGGIKITEPAADLAICMAIASASKGMQLKQNAVVFGEVGLSGEVRHVPFSDKRLAEAKKLGFEVAIGPRNKSIKSDILVQVSDVKGALNTFLSKD